MRDKSKDINIELKAKELPPTGLELIILERQRQLERWSAEHDDEHTAGELALVAALYASPIPLFEKREYEDIGISFVDPWPWFNELEVTRYGDGTTCKVKAHDKRKKHNRLRNLVVAGALIAAEVDRLQRKMVSQRNM